METRITVTGGELDQKEIDAFVEHLRANTNAPMILKRTPMSLFIRFDRRIFLR